MPKKTQVRFTDNIINDIGFMTSVRSSKSVVYGILNPVSNQVFYIGATLRQSMISRFCGHMNPRNKKLGVRWEINQIIRAGKMPLFMIIDYLPMHGGKARDAFESLWIARTREMGYSLHNSDKYPSQYIENYGYADRYEVCGSNDAVRLIRFEYTPLEYIKLFRAKYELGFHVKRLGQPTLLYSDRRDKKIFQNVA